MPPGDGPLIVGAVLGVLGTLGTVLTILTLADRHWVTRLEYVATLQSIDKRLGAIEERDKQRQP